MKYDIVMIVNGCLSYAALNANTVIGYKVAYFWECCNVCIIDHHVNCCLDHVDPEIMSCRLY